MFTIHSRRATKEGYADWEQAAIEARRMVLQDGAADVWIEDTDE